MNGRKYDDRLVRGMKEVWNVTVGHPALDWY